jgi:hypothetical protein
MSDAASKQLRWPEQQAKAPRPPTPKGPKETAPGAPPAAKEKPVPQVAPQAAGHQPVADADVEPDARALFGAACAGILHRAEVTGQRPPFTASALRYLAPGRKDGPPRPGALERAVKGFAALLECECPDQIIDDTMARAFKKRVKSLLGRNLPPFAGHPQEDSISRATELRKQGWKWKEIYPQVIPNHPLLHPAVRRQAESNLRSSLRSRRNARARRKREGESIAQTTSVPIVSS